MFAHSAAWFAANCDNFNYSIVIDHRFGVVTVFLLVKDVFSGLLFGAANGSGYADGAAPPVYLTSRILWSAGSGETPLTTGQGGAGMCRCWRASDGVEVMLSDVRAGADASFSGVYAAHS